MEAASTYAIGVDLGGTKIEVAVVDAKGKIHQRVRRATRAESGPATIRGEIISAAQELQKDSDSPPAGVGVGVAGQVDPKSGLIYFAPNLDWHNEPLQSDLNHALGLPVVITNDVRAATWGEWLYGAGQGCNDLLCLFVGTGIGGGVVSGGQLLTGCSNTAGEIGHTIIDLKGPPCSCGSRGCFEALAGGWAIAREAREAISADPSAGDTLLKLAGQPEAITAEIVSEAFRINDLLASHLVDKVTQALIAGCASLVNAFNPCRLILGGGVIEGLPELLDRIDHGIRQKALSAATRSLQVLPSQLKSDAGVIGAAALAIRLFTSREGSRNGK
jgi:glucokinase